jgi:flavin-dependent dehydrogenase
MKVAVVGGGPAGSLVAYHVARAGGSATVFDASHPREKPGGGGVTAKALALLPPAPAHDPLPARFVTACRFEAKASTCRSRSRWRSLPGARWTAGF